ncbi:hypothetical protein PLUTE_b0804 [Pseudoalteromonas luteoviolacea DSM 6061]|nr:hypothetical protein [Pseudoalteromonas luteoviolacea DSM 6061]
MPSWHNWACSLGHTVNLWQNNDNYQSKANALLFYFNCLGRNFTS